MWQQGLRLQDDRRNRDTGHVMSRPYPLDFAIVIKFCDEDQVWVAECFEIPCCTVTGQTSHEAFKECYRAIDDYLDVCEEKGLSFPKPQWERFRRDELMKLCGADPTLIDFDTWQKEQLESIIERSEGRGRLIDE